VSGETGVAIYHTIRSNESCFCGKHRNVFFYSKAITLEYIFIEKLRYLKDTV